MAYEGRVVPNEEGQQELEQRFRTSASFWDVGVHEWQTNAVPRREARATVARFGLHGLYAP